MHPSKQDSSLAVQGPPVSTLVTKHERTLRKTRRDGMGLGLGGEMGWKKWPHHTRCIVHGTWTLLTWLDPEMTKTTCCVLLLLLLLLLYIAPQEHAVCSDPSQDL